MATYLKRYLRAALKTFPRLEPPVRRAQFIIWKNLVRYRNIFITNGLIDPHRMLIADTQVVQDALIWGPEQYNKFGDRGKIIGGDWDKKIIRFTDLDVYRSFENHFRYQVPWEETEYFKRILRQVLSGQEKKGMKNAQDVRRRFNYFDTLFTMIKTSGYKSSNCLEGGHISSWAGEEDEISVRIGRDGDLLFEDGRHRLTIAKILDIKTVPIKVTVRHRLWFNFISEVISYARQQGGKIYNIITHPDLKLIPALHGIERFNLIKKSLPFCKGTVLDIGAHWGFFCHQFEKLGFDCTAVEVMPQHSYFLRKLKRAENRKFQILSDSIFNCPTLEYDLVLALNIFHHFIKTKELHLKLEELLHRMKTRALYFGCHNKDQTGMKGAYQNYSPQEFVEFILDNTHFKRVRHIGTEEGRREIYLFEND